MKNVVLVDCVSTSINFIKDCQQSGFNPVVLELPWIKKDNALHYNYTVFGAKQPDVVEANKNYKKTLELIKKLNPVCIIPCTDNSIEWALRLSNDLDLPSSKYSNCEKMRDKYICQKALRAKKIRSIESVEYQNWKQSLQFFHQHDNLIIVKPAKGTSSINVCVCRNEQQLKEAIELCLKHSDALTSGNILLQEYIDGKEYVVNTCSCGKFIGVTSVWVYQKQEVPGRAPIYLRLDFMDPKDPSFKSIINYCLKVVKTIGVTHGLCHCEIKVDKKGPVLIEANCRTPGGSMQGDYLDLVLGHHETNLSLLSYTNPKLFKKTMHKGFVQKYYGLMKFLVIKRKIYVKRDKFSEAFKKLPSYRFSNFGALFHAKNQWLEKTVDYHTTGGVIFLAHKYFDQIRKDYYEILDMENKHLDKLFEIVKKPNKK